MMQFFKDAQSIETFYTDNRHPYQVRYAKDDCNKSLCFYFLRNKSNPLPLHIVANTYKDYLRLLKILRAKNFKIPDYRPGDDFQYAVSLYNLEDIGRVKELFSEKMNAAEFRTRIPTDNKHPMQGTPKLAIRKNLTCSDLYQSKAQPKCPSEPQHSLTTREDAFMLHAQDAEEIQRALDNSL